MLWLLRSTTKVIQLLGKEEWLGQRLRKDASNFDLTIDVVDPKSEVALGTLGHFMLELGRIDDAIEYLEQAIAKSRSEDDAIGFVQYSEAANDCRRPSRSYGTLSFSRPTCFVKRISTPRKKKRIICPLSSFMLYVASNSSIYHNTLL